MDEQKLKDLHKAIDKIFKEEEDVKKIKSLVKRQITKVLK